MRIKGSDKIMTINSKYLRKPYATGFKFKINNKGGKRCLELVLFQNAKTCISIPFSSWSAIIPTLEQIQANI